MALSEGSAFANQVVLYDNYQSKKQLVTPSTDLQHKVDNRS